MQAANQAAHAGCTLLSGAARSPNLAAALLAVRAVLEETQVDEFARAGITKAACIDAPGARVAESPCHFECRYLSTHSLRGNSPVGGVDVVYGKVMRIHVADRVILSSGKLDITKIQPIARMGYYDYATITDSFEMRIPSASGAAEDGLEGKPPSVNKE